MSVLRHQISSERQALSTAYYCYPGTGKLSRKRVFRFKNHAFMGYGDTRPAVITYLWTLVTDFPITLVTSTKHICLLTSIIKHSMLVECPVCEPSLSGIPAREVCDVTNGNKMFKTCRRGTYVNEVCGNRLDCYRVTFLIFTNSSYFDFP